MKEQAKRGKMAGGGAILEFGELRERNRQGAYLPTYLGLTLPTLPILM